jgi:predicted transcriptional regulator
VGQYIKASNSLIFVSFCITYELRLTNLKGEIDMSMLIVGNDPVFNQWSLDLFNYMWERAGPRSPDKAKIV